MDDTDGLDPEGEFEAWRLRELARIKRDKEEAMLQVKVISGAGFESQALTESRDELESWAI